MSALIYLFLLGIIAGLVQSRVALLHGFHGLPRYLCAFGLTLFLANWTNFLLYVLAGWSALYVPLTWSVLLLALLYFSNVWKLAGPARVQGVETERPRSPAVPGKWNYSFLFLAVFVGARFYAGLDVDGESNVWSLFNFVDTAFHLSVANAFLAAPHFPPMDLDMAPYPLKYHFLADFYLAHLSQLGLRPISGIWLMNLISSLAMAGALWATFERWLKLPPRWVMLACLILLFLNTALINLVHFLVLNPPYLDPSNLYYGLIRFPYFNFESTLANMLEPQRGLLFSLPIVLLILHAAFGHFPERGQEAAGRVRTLQAFILVCLLPLGHIVAFAIMAPCLLPKLWQHRVWFLQRWGIWLPVFILGLLQLLYLGCYGPPTNTSYAGWAETPLPPLQDFLLFPPFTRRAAFWFFTNGDFLFWGLLFAGIAAARWRGRDPAANSSLDLWQFLLAWRWYFVVTGACFVLINYFRYSFDWGDSNKPVFFLNLGLSLVITLGAAQWLNRRQRVLSHALWVFFFLLCVAPPTYSFYLNIIKPGHGAGTVLLFEKNSRAAAAWIAASVKPTELILTSAYNTFHFVTPLAGRPTLAGIYADSNPYRQDERQEQIRRVYERGERQLLPVLGVRYVCISRNERRRYQIDSSWTHLMNSGTGVVFQAGEGPEDSHSVYIFDAQKLRAP